MPEVQPNAKFLEFLENTPEALAKFVSIVNEWYKLQGEAPKPVREEEGPREWKAGEEHELTTKGISHEDLDALSKGFAEAVVKEKAIAYIKGFIAGIMLVV